MPEVETLMLANHAESQNGLLYLHGGGWSHHWRGLPPSGQPVPQSQIAVAATFLLEQADSRKSHVFAIRISSDAGEEVMQAEGKIDLSPSPAPVTSASPQRTVIAANANVQFPHEGHYTLRATIEGGDERSVDFWVHDQAPGAAGPGRLGASAPSQPGGDSGSTAGYL